MYATMDYKSSKFSERKLHNDLIKTKKLIKKMELEKASITKKLNNYLERENLIKQALIYKLNTPTEETIEALKNSETIGRFKSFEELKFALNNED